MMVPPPITVDLRGPTEIREEDPEGFIEHPPHLEICQKSGDCAVENREKPVLHLRKVVSMRIPIIPAAAGEVTGGTKRLDDRNTGLDKTP